MAMDEPSGMMIRCQTKSALLCPKATMLLYVPTSLDP
jgi:hypothetical protein